MGDDDADVTRDMKDHEYLDWIFSRLVNVYGERPDVGYMIRLSNMINEMKLVAKFVDNALEPRAELKWRDPALGEGRRRRLPGSGLWSR